MTDTLACETPMVDHLRSAITKMKSGEWFLTLAHPNPAEGSAHYGTDVAVALAAALDPSPDMREAVEALEEYAREATKAITGLVGGGSELFGKRIGDLYTADLEYCVARIRNRFADGHEARVALAKAETNLRHWREECGKLHAQVRSLTGAKP